MNPGLVHAKTSSSERGGMPVGAGDQEKFEQLEKQLVFERRKLRAELEEKKEEIRQAKD